MSERGQGSRRATWAALALACAAVLPATAQAETAHAVVPDAGDGEAVVQLYAGDYRTGPTSIGPAVAGIVFGLFATSPAASIRETDGFVDPATAPLFTCTSQADGDCVFTVPVRAGAVDSTGVPQGTRLWAAPISSPASVTEGYYANPFWQTAPLSNTDQVPLRHVFQTPGLVGGQEYLAGRDWILDPGQQTDPANPARDFGRRTASGGVWPLSRYDPDLPETCGLNVAIVVDLSSSVQQAGAVPQLVAAIDAFVDALHGTPSQAALFTFGTDSPANGFGPNSSLMPVATTADADAFEALYSGWTSTPTNYTNWDRALAAPAAVNADEGNPDHFDVVVMITDGNPTVYGPNPLNAQGGLRDANSGYTRFRELGNGNASANLLKSQGTRILAVGVGTGVAGTGSEYNLRTISGRDPYTGGNILDADYFQTADYASAGTALHDLVLASCAPSVSVIKRIVPFGAVDTSEAFLPGDRWTFAATSTDPGVAVAPTSGQTDPATGAIAFDLDFTAGPVPVTVTEDTATPPGYTPRDDLTECINKSEDDTPVTPVQTVGTGTMTLDLSVGLEDAISCIVYNEAPDGFDPASVVVDKRWRVTSAAGVQDAPEGAQPVGLESRLMLSGPATADLSEQGWGVERGGYDASLTAPDPARTVDLAEEVAIVGLPGCHVTEVTLEPGAPGASAPGSGTVLYDGGGPDPQVPPADPSASDLALAEGVNRWTVTNAVTCASYLTLVKDVGETAADPAWWTLSATGPDGGLPGPAGVTGTPGVTHVEVTPDVDYQLAETVLVGAPHDAIHHVQNDFRTRPLAHPASSGSWSCDPDVSFAAEGAVAVPLGAQYTCSAINRTALLTVTKTVTGGTAAPASFRFTVAPLAPVVPGGHAHDVTPGVVQTLVPGQHYALSEVGSHEDYELTALTCTTAGQPLDPADFSVPPGASVACAATNQAILPATGAEAPWWSWAAGGALVVLGAALTSLSRRRVRRRAVR